MNIQDAITYAVKELQTGAVCAENHVTQNDLRLDAEVLLSFCLEKPRSHLLAWPEKNLSNEQLKQFQALIKKRSTNYPVAYLTQHQEFWSLDFFVNENVLIPRPETECLVEFVLDHFSNTGTKQESDSGISGLDICGLDIFGLDMGTGSGAISIALASEQLTWKICACDKSEQALTVAKNNALALQTKNVEFILSDWFSNISHQEFDFIISNPPYVEDEALELSTEAIQFEPRSALCSGADGLTDIKLICEQAGGHLKKAGLLIIEHGHTQGEQVKEIFERNNFIQVQCLKDYSGLDRFTIGYTAH